ncbi:VOC family protein [Amycolatopsis sp. NPDC059027]|uniref:VOC family protein n=1 Tax=Amycolatopsis sp. NPDC059027 TaxID=3346709 RepID=UPI00366CD9F4
MRTRMIAVAFDCHRPEIVAAFWRAALGYGTVERWTDEDGTGYVEVKEAGQPSLLFQPVPEGKCNEDVTTKNPVHLDVWVGSDHVEDQLARLTERGATFLHRGRQGPHRWVTLQDPEGNEFCIS